MTWEIQKGKSLEQLYFTRLLICYFPDEPHNKAMTFTNLYERLPPTARIGLAAAQGDLATIITELAKHLGLSTELENQLKTLTFDALLTLLKAKSPETVSCIDSIRNDNLTPLF